MHQTQITPTISLQNDPLSHSRSFPYTVDIKFRKKKSSIRFTHKWIKLLIQWAHQAKLQQKTIQVFIISVTLKISFVPITSKFTIQISTLSTGATPKNKYSNGSPIVGCFFFLFCDDKLTKTNRNFSTNNCFLFLFLFRPLIGFWWFFGRGNRFESNTIQQLKSNIYVPAVFITFLNQFFGSPIWWETYMSCECNCGV